MKHLRGIVVLLAVVFLAGPAAHADLARDIRNILRHEQLKDVEVGIEIVRLHDAGRSPRVLYRQNHEQTFMPASNMKLITTAAALKLLGPEFRFRTLLVLEGQDLVVVADGDPTIGDTLLLRDTGWEVDTVFKEWATQLRQRGITSVRHVKVDDAVFDEEFYHPEWSDNYSQARYAAQVAGLNLNVNCLQVTVQADGMGQLVAYTLSPDTRYASIRNTCVMGESDAIWLSRQPLTNEIMLRGETPNRTSSVWVTIHDPSLFAGTVLAETLETNDLRVTGQVQRDRAGRDAEQLLAEPAGENRLVVAVHETPLTAMLGRFNKDSVNLYGESLCKRMGFAATGESGSWDNGTRAVGEFLRGIGIPPEQFTLSDGSGLSRGNRLSPSGIIKVLVHSYEQPTRQVYIDAMAVGGGDGTLRNRFRDMDVAGRVFGKSGYIGGVSALSGYLQGRDGEWYAFSILMNGIAPGTNATMRGLQDRIVEAIDKNVP